MIDSRCAALWTGALNLTRICLLPILQMFSGIDCARTLLKEADVTGDNRVTLAEFMDAFEFKCVELETEPHLPPPPPPVLGDGLCSHSHSHRSSSELFLFLFSRPDSPSPHCISAGGGPTGAASRTV